MPLTPQEQTELDDLELRALESQAAAYESSQADMSVSRVDPNKIGKVPPPTPRAPMTPMESAIDMGKSMAIQGGLTAVGQVVGGATGLAAPIMVPALGGLGAGVGYMVDQARKDEEITAGGLVGSMAAGAIPGSPAAMAGKVAIAKEAARQGGFNFLAKNAETLIDEGRPTTFGEAGNAFFGGAAGEYGARGVGKLVKAGRPVAPLNQKETFEAGVNDTLRKIRKEGAVIAPHTVGRGSDLVSSIGGKAAMTQQAAKKNQPVWNRMAREDIGLTGALPIYDETLENVRKQAAAPYEEIKRISDEAGTKLAELRKGISNAAAGDRVQERILEEQAKGALDPLIVQAGANVEALKMQRVASKKAWDEFRGGDPSAYTRWQESVAKSDALEAQIEEAGALTGNKKLVNDLRRSRRIIAKTHAVQEAINPVSGWVDPVVLGRIRKARMPLDGKLKLIADAQLVFNKEAIEASRVPSPGVDNMSTKFALSSAAHGSPTGTVAAIAQGTIGAIPRRALLSESLQNVMVDPRRKTNAVPNILQFMSRFGPMAEGRDDNAFLSRAKRQ